MEWTQYVDDDVDEAVTVALADDDIDEIGDGINETEFADEEMIDVDPDYEMNDDERLAENLGNDLIRSTRAIRPLRLTQEEIDEINSGDVMSNYVKDLTDRSALDELRSKELEFFNQKEISDEIETALEVFCTSERVDKEVRRIWLAENSTRKQIREKDHREAKVLIKNRERVEVRLTIEGRREDLFRSKYGHSSSS